MSIRITIKRVPRFIAQTHLFVFSVTIWSRAFPSAKHRVTLFCLLGSFDVCFNHCITCVLYRIIEITFHDNNISPLRNNMNRSPAGTSYLNDSRHVMWRNNVALGWNLKYVIIHRLVYHSYIPYQ